MGLNDDITTEYQNKDTSSNIKSNQENNQKYELDSLSFYPKSLKKFKNKFEEDYFKTKKSEKEEEKEEQSQKKYRTELCKYFEINGRCKFGENCIFAHGKENLRENLCKKSGYKKRPCVNFFDKGYCMYGNRCQFSHDLKFDNNLNKDESLNFSYKMFFNKLINTSKENNDEENKKNIMKIKERPRLKVFKKFVKIKKSVYKKKKNYIDEILGNSKKKK